MAAATLTTALRAVNEGQRQLKEYGDSVKMIGDKAEDAGKRGNSAMGGLGKSLLDVGKIAGGFVIGAGLMKLPGLFGGMMESASAFNETLSKSNTVFKENAKEIEEWADGAAKAFGQSKQQALDAAGSFGNLFRQIGFSGDSAAWLSKGMTELASDFASFHNADITEVINAQSAAFRGEYDALQRFVPTINAAAVEQQALIESGKESAKTLTAQEKAAATYTLMMKGAGDAIGDFARTSDGAANQGRILDARMADLSATMGQKLLPIKVAVTQFVLDKAIPAFEKFAAWAGPRLKDGIEALKPAFDAWLKWQETQVVFIKDHVIPAVRDFIEFAKPKLTEFADFAGKKFAEFKGYYQTDIKPALENIQKLIQYVVDWTVEHWPEIERVVKPVIEQVIAQIQVAKDIIVNVLQIIIDLIGGDFSGAWENLKELIGGVRDYIGETINNAAELVKNAAPLMLEAGKKVGGALKDGILDALSAAGGAALDFAKALGNAIARLINENIIRPINRALEFSFDTHVPGIGTININPPDVPDIPMMAKGGIVTRPTLAVVGEAGPEAVVPLSRAGGAGFANFGGDQTVIIQIDGAEVGRAVIRQMGRGYA